MLKKNHSIIALICLSFLSIPFIHSEESVDKSKSTKESVSEVPATVFKEEFSETKHAVVIGGQSVPYKAIAGNLLLKDDKGSDKASMFFISYTKEGGDNKVPRPITFCFNGGPGSSSVWLHLGAFGPKRVALTNSGDAVPPFYLIDNEYSLLDQTDLVFIDPISTGYSRAIPYDDAKKFHSYEEDIKSIAHFIRLYLTKYNRWDSPKFLAGESYGTTRAAGLAARLHDEDYIYINGVILISSVLNFQSILFNDGNDLSYLMYLPSYTSTAWYHKRLPSDLQASFTQSIEESKKFVTEEYSVALFKGDLLPKEERASIVKKLARYTGLSPDYIENSNLRVDMMHFAKELLRDQRMSVGRFDSRFKGMESNQVGETFEYDPSMEAIFGAFTATLNYYMRNDLKWEKQEDYKILPNLANWDFSIATNQYLNVTDKLKSVMIRNPHIRVFVANGYYDLATPFYGTEFTFNHLGQNAIFTKHVDMQYYKAGHMMYNDLTSLIKLKSDLTNYFNNTLQVQEEGL